jgi:UPF0271 protein
MGLRLVEEFYADRAYNENLLLVPRGQSGAVIHDISEIQKRILQLVNDGTVTTVNGHVMEMSCQSIAVHGDSPDALEIVKKIRSSLETNHVKITPLKNLIQG